MDGRTDGWMDGCVGRWVVGRVDDLEVLHEERLELLAGDDREAEAREVCTQEWVEDLRAADQVLQVVQEPKALFVRHAREDVVGVDTAAHAALAHVLDLVCQTDCACEGGGWVGMSTVKRWRSPMRSTSFARLIALAKGGGVGGGGRHKNGEQVAFADVLDCVCQVDGACQGESEGGSAPEPRTDGAR
eukprot:362014-Chlamydomonas_euryale.AAC.3